MKKLLFFTVFAALFLGLMAPANAAIYDVTEDLYTAMGGNWFDKPYVKTYEFTTPGYESYAYSKFDIQSAYDDGWRAYDPDLRAYFHFYKTRRQKAGLIEVPVGMEDNFEINAYDSPYDSEPAGDPAHYVPGTHIHHDRTATATEEWFSLDITEIVKGWLDYIGSAGTEGFENYGIEIYKAGYDGYGWYWNSSTSFPGSEFPTNPGWHPDLTVVPIPGTLLLLGSGLIGLIGIRRRKKA